MWTRIATLVMAFFFMILLSHKAYTIHHVDVVAGYINMVLAIMYLNGAALSLDVPLASVMIFVIAAITSRFAPVGLQFHHRIWALISIILAITSYFGYREATGKGKSSFR